MLSSALITHRRTLALAVPLMLANLSTPLLGMVDTAVVGQLPGAANIGAVAVGALIFTFVFWAFGFLRMGTTGLTAQALGGGDAEEVVCALLRALFLAGLIGVLLMLTQWPIAALAWFLLEAPASVESLAGSYFDIRIYAAPATLGNYALVGWFVGLARTRTALTLQLVLNLVNIALDALFVLVLGLGVDGVALGTVLAEYTALVLGLILAWRELRRFPRASALLDRVWLAAPFKRMLAVNRDIMIRSLSLLLVFGWFMAAGARAGAAVLAANAVLMHFVSTAAYFLDGLAHTAETLVGHACGRRDRRSFHAAVTITSTWAVLLAALAAALLGMAGASLIDVITIDSTTRALAREFLPWAVAAPLLGVAAFQLDGIFIGATRSVEMRQAMLFALAVFIAAWYVLLPYGNHGLWAALSVHYVARAGGLFYYYPRLLRALG